MKTKLFLQISSTLVCSAAALSCAAADFPSRPITLVVPYSAGGGTDGVARLIAKGLSQALKQPVIVENAPGAEGLIGAQRVARAAADGYTLGIGVPIMLMYKHTHAAIDPLKLLTPISLLASAASALAVSAAANVKSMPELVQYCKATNKCSIGSGDQFSGIAGKFAMSKLGIEALDVPYKGGGPVIIALAGGQIDVGSVSLSAALPLYNAGKIRIVAAGGEMRSKLTPEVPSYTEAGLANMPFTSFWYGLFAPKNVPEKTIGEIRRALETLLKDEGLKAALDLVGVKPVMSTRAQFQTVFAQDQKILDDLIKRYPLDNK